MVQYLTSKVSNIFVCGSYRRQMKTATGSASCRHSEQTVRSDLCLFLSLLSSSNLRWESRRGNRTETYLGFQLALCSFISFLSHWARGMVAGCGYFLSANSNSVWLLPSFLYVVTALQPSSLRIGTSLSHNSWAPFWTHHRWTIHVDLFQYFQWWS